MTLERKVEPQPRGRVTSSSQPDLRRGFTLTVTLQPEAKYEKFSGILYPHLKISYETRLNCLYQSKQKKKIKVLLISINFKKYF